MAAATMAAKVEAAATAAKAAVTNLPRFGEVSAAVVRAIQACATAYACVRIGGAENRMKSTTAAKVAALVGGLVIASSSIAPAHAEKKPWWLSLEAGAEYDDNVSVEQNDDVTGNNDVAAIFEVDAGYKLLDTDTSRVEVGYDFYQSIYSDFSDFNYQEHSPGLTAWTKMDGIKLGFSYYYLHSLLDDKFFLDQHALSPSISTYVSDDLYLTFFYRYLNKDYNRLDDDRDANTHQGGADLYFDFDKPKKGYVSLGGSYVNEDTDGPAFDYQGFSGRASVQFPISLFNLPSRWRFAYTYQKRDYDNGASLTPPVAGQTREDDRHTIRTHIELDLTDELRAIAEYRYVNRISNLATADYDENVGGVSMRYSF
jgi:hypothetical protein